MDNVTHALAGCLLGAATIEIARRWTGIEPPLALRRAAYVVGVVTAELPDADLVYAGERLGMGQLGYLLHHRGHTHTVVFALAAGIVVWLLTIAWRPALRERAWSMSILGLALVGSLSHIALDYTNSYGVHPWWPIDNRWVYGDAVFIVEPWLFVVSLPLLFFLARSIAGKGLAVLLTAVILVLAWRVTMVSQGLAMALTVGTLVAYAAARSIPDRRRAFVGLAAWMGIEAMFFATSARARGVVARTVGPSLRDVVLTPAPANPFCVSALVLTQDGDAFTVTGAVVAPFAGVRSVDRCSGSGRTAVDGATTSRADTPSIRWSRARSASVDELRTLARDNCEVAAGLRFMRVPVWERLDDGRVQLYDQRFSDGGGGFASLVATASPASCPRYIPAWEWPRADMLGAAPPTVDVD